MNLNTWAELLLRMTAPGESIDLHIDDTLTAFLTGLRTKDAQVLARLYGGHTNPAELAAGVAGIARLSECDDIHLPSCITPGSAAISVALALARNAGSVDFNRAVAAGYAAGLQLGQAIGGTKALAHGVWPTLLAAPLMAAVTASCLSGHDAGQLAHAMALALAGASGRAGRPAGTPSGRWFVFAESVSKGIRAAEAAGESIRGDVMLVSEAWLAGEAGHADVDMGVFESKTAVPSLSDVGFKPFPIARQALNAVLAFRDLLSNGLDPRHIESIEVFVPAINVALLSRPLQDGNRLSRLSNIGFQLACAALTPDTLYDPERVVEPLTPLISFAERVSVRPANDLAAHFPAHWPARVVVNLSSGKCEGTVIRTPFDSDSAQVTELLRIKRRHLLPDEDQREFFAEQVLRTSPGHHATIWQAIERRLGESAKKR